MKICPFCKEEIKIDAIKCRYCGSMLNIDSTNDEESNDKITYVIDKGLIRYAKFSISILSLIVVVGATLGGIDLRQAVREAKEIQSETKQIAKDATDAKNKCDSILNAAKFAASSNLQEIVQTNEKSKGILNEQMSTFASVSPNKQAVAEIVSEYLSNVLNEKQQKVLNKNIEKAKSEVLEVKEIRKLVQADVDIALSYFKDHGFKIKPITPKIQVGINNAYWDGQTLVYGTEMATSDMFGPYSSDVVFHQVTYSLFSIKWEGESEAVAISICDVMAVLIRGGKWEVGHINTNNEKKPIRSLESPVISHLKDSKKDSDPHELCGILDKAAYLMSEGGNFRGTNISKGIGPKKLGLLYMEAIKRLPNKAYLNFTGFRDIVIQTSKDVFDDKSEILAVGQAFQAVGL